MANKEPSPYINRELSWLAFNRRVLEEAQDSDNLLLERAKFLAITSSNLDEFCMVRLAKVRRGVDDTQDDPSGLRPAEQLELIRDELSRFSPEMHECWENDIREALAEEGLQIVPESDWKPDERRTLKALYRDTIEPAITPLGVGEKREFPFLNNLQLNLAVELQSTDAEENATRHAVLKIPDGDRLLPLNEEAGRYAMREDVLAAFADDLFEGYDVKSIGCFRLTRDTLMEIEEDEEEDLLQEMQEGLRYRGQGAVVRLEIGRTMPDNLKRWLKENLGLDEADIHESYGTPDLAFCFRLPGLLRRPDLLRAPTAPVLNPPDWSDAFSLIADGDILLHHPYESFDPIVQLLSQAADDPDVLAIKQTLYRVSGDSPVVQALIRAARQGKQVTVLVELKARFDEAANIHWAKMLQDAGAQVIYGVVGYKVHCKLLMVIRREHGSFRRYCHVGTGNYHDKNAQIYTDLSYLTHNDGVGRDVAALFNMLTGYSEPKSWERLLVAPRDMRPRLLELIDQEIANAKEGLPAYIVGKCNSLSDGKVAAKLYEASQAGVQIDLIIRGICILRAGVEGLSENIRVRSIKFANNDSPIYYMGSADLMPRNLISRVETLLSVEDEDLQERLDQILDCMLNDNAQARVLQPDGTFTRLKPGGDEDARASQDLLLQDARQRAEIYREDHSRRGSFIPLTRPNI